MRRSVIIGVAIIAIALIALIAQFSVRLNGDSAFMLYAAGRVLDGGVLYVDLIEVNPPLAIWINLPLVVLARWLDVDSIVVFRGAMVLLLVLSIVSTVLISRRPRSSSTGSSRAWWMALALVVALLVLPRLDWGEREHLALGLMLPWLAVAARRLEGVVVPRKAALLAGLAAGLGIALKPHFVLVWVGRECAIRTGRRIGHTDSGKVRQTARRWGAHADTWSPVVVCVAYLAAAIALTPEYFDLATELAGPYSRFIRATVLETMFGAAPAVGLAAVAVTAGMRRLLPAESPSHRATTLVLLWSTAAWSVVAMLQLKGFRYHWYPAMALGFLLLCQLTMVARGLHIAFIGRLFRSIATAIVTTTVVLTTWETARQVATPESPEWDSDPSVGLLLEALEGRVKPGDTLAVLSPNMASGFPLTNYLGTEWPLRMPHLWPAIVSYAESLELGESPQLRAADSMKPLEEWSLGMVEQDLQRSQPEWLLVFRHFPQIASPHMAKLDLAAYLKRNAGIAQVWQGYDSLGTVGLYSVWRAADAESSAPLGDVQWPHTGSANASRRISIADLAAIGGVLCVAVATLDLIAGRMVLTRSSRPFAKL